MNDAYVVESDLFLILLRKKSLIACPFDFNNAVPVIGH